jgi:hypothetical protein
VNYTVGRNANERLNLGVLLIPSKAPIRIKNGVVDGGNCNADAKVQLVGRHEFVVQNSESAPNLHAIKEK